MSATTKDRLVSVREAAALLGCSPATIWRRSADGTIPQPVKIGGMTRWSMSEIAAAIEDAKSQRSAA